MTPFVVVYCLVLVYWCVVYNALYGCIMFGMFVLFYYVLYVTSSVFVSCFDLVYWCVVYNVLCGCIMFGPSLLVCCI